MAGFERDDDLSRHIEALASQSSHDALRLTDALRRRSWPGGQADRREPAAMPWLRRWRPQGAPFTAVACGCADGRCLVCN